MALETLPDNREDEKLNPGQKHYDNTIGSGYTSSGIDQVEASANDSKNHTAQSLNDAEQQGTVQDTPADVRQQELQGDALAAPQIRSTYTGAKDKNKRPRKAWFKKAAPALGIGGTFTIVGIVLVALTTPSLLIVQMKEIMTSKFNTQLSSMNTRSNKLLLAKVAGATSGICTTKVSLPCKFQAMNDTQVKSLKEAGFSFDGEKKGINGTTAKAFVYDGKSYDARSFPSAIANDQDLRNAFKDAYNPKYAGFTGKAWAAVASFFKISKQAPDLGADDPEKAKLKLQDIAKEGMVDEAGTTKPIVVGQEKPGCTGNNCTWTQADVDAATAASNALTTDAKSGGAIAKVKDSLASLSAGTAGHLVAITGMVDSTCSAIGAFNTLTYAAKAIRVLQLVRYMMVFSSVADSIKAGGNPKPADVAYLGTILTSTVAAKAGKLSMGSATDSFGYKYAAYGDSSASTNSMNIANRFMAGGGMVGSLSNFSNTIYSFFGGGSPSHARSVAHGTCGVLANPVVQGVSIIVGIGALFVPGVNVGLEIAKAGATAAVGIGISMIPSLVADIVAGTVTDGIKGEESGDAIASGYGSLLSNSLAGQNGAAPMTKADTIAYNEQQSATNDQYIADELKTTSPFDATNPHTFVGSIVASLLPLRAQSNPLASVGTLISTSFKNLIPTSNALSSADYAKSLDVCQDPDAVDTGFAVDPFCNVIRGIPPQYVNRDPIEVAQALIDSGQMSDDGTPQGAYADFVSKCVTSQEPLGYSSGTEFVPEDAKNCIINDSNANYYLNYMDQRINLGMSGLDNADATSTPATSNDKKAIAQKIVAKNKVSYIDNSQPTLDKIADGTDDPNAMPCGININILRIIDTITDTHSITISDINRLCNGTVQASGNGSRHNAGNGSAIDISSIDGKATNGRDANALSLIQIAMPILSSAATTSGSYSQVGQSECGANPQMATGVSLFNDTCNHLHLDVPPKSDPTLKYDPSGW